MNRDAQEILALAQTLHAAREWEAATHAELLRVLRASPAVDQDAQSCWIVAPDRALWHVFWNGALVSVKRVDAQDPVQALD